MKQIKLGGKLGLIALVDDEDFDRVSLVKWHPVKSLNPDGSLSAYYAQGSPSSLLMHRVILEINDKNKHVDHINRNGLDNQKDNLRIGTRSQNLSNRPKSKTNTSGFKGVYKSTKSNSWFSVISFMDKNKYLGTFKTKEDAARAYDKAALEQWQQFAFLNFKK